VQLLPWLSILIDFVKAFRAGEFITALEGLTKSPKAYTSVQCGPGLDDHVELNSDLVYGVPYFCCPGSFPQLVYS
jgi:hypothetical protein